jgi:hypothetical protein
VKIPEVSFLFLIIVHSNQTELGKFSFLMHKFKIINHSMHSERVRDRNREDLLAKHRRVIELCTSTIHTSTIHHHSASRGYYDEIQ